MVGVGVDVGKDYKYESFVPFFAFFFVVRQDGTLVRLLLHALGNKGIVIILIFVLKISTVFYVIF